MEILCQQVCVVGTLLVLSLLLSPLYGVKVSSSGAHLLVLQGQHFHWGHEENLRHRRNVQEETERQVDVRQFHLSSMLYSRFATVTIESEVMNLAEGEGQEITFQVQVPENAFMSNFTMVVDGQLYVAEVLEKAAAEERYREAVERNQTAGQVKHDSVKPERDMELFTISVNLAPNATAFFTLVYNELLKRRRGIYQQKLMVQPGAIVDDMSVHVAFAERQGFSYFAYAIPGSDLKRTSSSEEGQTQMTASPTTRELIFRPTVEMQHDFDPQKGIHGLFTILYRVNDEAEGGSIIVQNEYFAHFFAPPGLTPLPMNILFVIDISGSMAGEKIQHAKEAMLHILEDLSTRPTDRFNILLFDDRVDYWETTSVFTTALNLERAKGFVQEHLQSRGGTNIYKALTDGLNLLLRGQETSQCDTANIIVFLTDGDPTVGVTNIDTIITDVTATNRDRVSIYCLGFGFNLNFAFLSKLSIRNRGSVRRIYDAADAETQLTDFYEEISNPLLCNVVARYSSDTVDADLLTLTSFPLFFQGAEIMVAGKTRVAAVGLRASDLDAQLHAIGAEGAQDFVVPVGKVDFITHTDRDLTQKLWAYMKIKSLLRDLEMLDSEVDRNRTRTQALNMSLTYGFVTPLTSFSIVVEDAVEKDMYAEAKTLNRKKLVPQGGSHNVRVFDHAGRACMLKWSGEVGWLLLTGWFIHFWTL